MKNKSYAMGVHRVTHDTSCSSKAHGLIRIMADLILLEGQTRARADFQVLGYPPEGTRNISRSGALVALG